MTSSIQSMKWIKMSHENQATGIQPPRNKHTFSTDMKNWDDNVDNLGQENMESLL